MPKLDENRRLAIDSRVARHAEIEKKFEGRHYTGMQCRLCGWASNSLTFDEAIEESRKHERSHPEYAEWQATLLKADEIVASLHDHECKMEYCACKCGCHTGPFCTLVFGPLCSVCSVREIRGDDEHGLPEEISERK